MDYRFKFRRKPKSAVEQREEHRQESNRVKQARGLAVGLSIPMTLAGGPLLGWLIGSMLDNKLGTGYWMATLIVVGTIAGFKGMIDMLVKLGKDQ